MRTAIDQNDLERASRLAEPLDAAPGADDGTVEVAVHETHADELAWLAREVVASHEAGGRWADIGVLTRDNQHAADVFDALTSPRVYKHAWSADDAAGVIRESRGKMFDPDVVTAFESLFARGAIGNLK